MSLKNVFKIVSIMTFINIFGKFLGLFRESLIAKTFGADYRMDAYNIALLIPLIFYDMVGTAILTTLIPTLSQILKNDNKESMFKYCNNIINIAFLFSISAGIIGFCLSTPIVKFLAPGLSPKTVILAENLVRLTMINCILFSMTSICQAVLQVLNKFIFQTFLGVMLSLPIIAYLLLFAGADILGLTIATILGYALQAIFLIISLSNNGFKYEFTINIYDSRLKSMIKLMGPVLITVSVTQINVIVDRIFASSLPEGSIASLAYASKLYLMFFNIFFGSIIVLSYPKFAMISANNALEILKKNFVTSIKYVNLFLIPASFAIIALSRTIINIIYKRGNFDETAVATTSIALICFSVGMMSFGMIGLGNRVFFSLNDTRTPMNNGIVNMAVHIIVNFLLIKKFGIAALALSTSFASIVSAGLILYKLHNKLGGINLKEVLKYNLKIIISALIMGLAVFFVNEFICINSISFFLLNIIGLVTSTVVGLIIYFSLIYLFKIEEFTVILKLFLNKIRVS